jgi:mono/diheme cytochrome c family protein
MICRHRSLRFRDVPGEALVKLISLGAVIAFATSVAAAQDAAALKRGEALLARNCSRCHATARTDANPSENAGDKRAAAETGRAPGRRA